MLGDEEVVIECPFTLTTDGSTHVLDPEERAALGPLLDIHPDALTASSVDDDGTLRLQFESGATVEVPPDPGLEAWQLNRAGTTGIVVYPRRPA